MVRFLFCECLVPCLLVTVKSDRGSEHQSPSEEPQMLLRQCLTWTMSLSAMRPLEDTLTSSPSSSSIAADNTHMVSCTTEPH